MANRSTLPPHAWVITARFPATCPPRGQQIEQGKKIAKTATG